MDGPKSVFLSVRAVSESFCFLNGYRLFELADVSGKGCASFLTGCAIKDTVPQRRDPGQKNKDLREVDDFMFFYI